MVEDGGDLLLSEHTETQELTQRYVEAAKVILALQAHGFEAQSPNPDRRLDAERLRKELAFTEEHALRRWLKSDPSPCRDKAFERLAIATAQLPRRMCHRDYHSRNVLVGEELMVVDFQDAMEGPLFYDLVSLLGDDYRDVPTTAVVAAIETFWAIARTNVAVSAVADVPDEPSLLAAGARQGFALTAAQRSLKALGTFGYQISVAGRHEYATYASRTWNHAKRAIASLGWDDLLTELVVFDSL
jgi:aminoglycoside/choline kinase family phosphotransferase